MASSLGTIALAARSLAPTTRISAVSRAGFASLPQSHTPRRAIVCRKPPHNVASRAVTIRKASTTAEPPSDTLTWDRFFDLRRKRRYVNLGASLVTAAATVSVAGPILASQDIDTWGAQLTGMDPVFVLGLSTLAVAAGGWLCGPSFGSGAFGVWISRRGWAQAYQTKDRSFYKRIQQHRADPSSSSPQNPLPDYYGEKVASVKDYRRWLKDQRAFKLKKSKNLF
ncbi:hypothetical protein LTR62_006584 [Meristemomyces frigidus]|uniref:Presequence translocated-associated motor subunit PAM17 n=1 Tax=Meristemomyces frigidus TaxID=1508187 RepID=A0AAN7TBG4_9PEZI|nr:hypothetical protein LTR62_006584 [Meristemomyces frigidus]